METHEFVIAWLVSITGALLLASVIGLIWARILIRHDKEKDDTAMYQSYRYKDSLGSYLKGIRQSKKMTLRDVQKATKGSISNAYLCQLESGKRVNPSPHFLYVLSKVYNVPYEEMMVVAGYLGKVQKNGNR
jgi:hypothetical protein